MCLPRMISYKSRRFNGFVSKVCQLPAAVLNSLLQISELLWE